MPNYKEKIAEFENNFSTVIDKSVRDLSMAFDNLYLDKNAKEIPPTIKLAEALLSGEHNISTKMQIHYDIANAYHDLRMIEGVYSERYLEKELYHLRCALDMYTHSDNPLVKAMYWLQKDFYERKEINVTTPHAERIFQMRNDIEHNCLRTGTQSHNTSLAIYIPFYRLKHNIGVFIISIRPRFSKGLTKQHFKSVRTARI